jgi:hypothetical protein
MLIKRKVFGSVFVAGAAVAAIIATPAAVIANAPATTTHQVVLADNGNVHGSGGGDGQGGSGGCGNGPGWHGCGGWNPSVGGFGGGCSNGVCGGWDGVRGWGNF